MAVFDVQPDQSIRFTATKSAFLSQAYTIERKKTLAGQDWERLGDWHWPDETLVYGATGVVTQYRVEGYHAGSKSAERQQDDGHTCVVRFEDAEDNDWNDLIVVCERLIVKVNLNLLHKANPDWRPIEVEGFAAALVPASAKTNDALQFAELLTRKHHTKTDSARG